MPRTKWQPEDFGRAMEAAVLQHARPKCLKRKGDRVWFNGFHRGGDDPNCVVDVRSGNWSDLKTGEHGIARDFAAVFFGCGVAEFMERWGPNPMSGPRAARSEGPRAPVARCRWDVPALWDRLVGAMPEQRTDPATRWLTAIRGFPPQASDLIPSGFVTIGRGQVALFPDELQGWIRRLVAKVGILIAAPLRDAATGEVENIQFRAIAPPPDLDDNGRRWLPDASLSDPEDGTPRGYGDVYRALRADVVVVVEGMADTFCGESWMLEHGEVAVVGVASSSTFVHWQRFLARKPRGRVVVACQLDKPDRNGMRVGIERAAEMVTALDKKGVRCAFFDWSRFLWAMSLPTKNPPIKDLGDAQKLVGWGPAKAAFVAAVGASLGRERGSGSGAGEGGGAARSEGGGARGEAEDRRPAPA
jgi:hypothetical protein